MENKEKYYSYQDMVVLNDSGYQCSLINNELWSNDDVMFAPNKVLATNFIDGTIDILDCEVSCGQITNTKSHDVLCEISELFEVSEGEAKKIIQGQINTISEYKALWKHIER